MENEDYKNLFGKRILLIEDDPHMVGKIVSNLEEYDCVVDHANNIQDAKLILRNSKKLYHLAIIDMYIPENDGDPYDRVMRGEEFAQYIRKSSPKTFIVGISNSLETKPHTLLYELFSGFIYKEHIPNNNRPLILFETIENVLTPVKKRRPKIFIVHGHDETLLLQLKDYLRNTLKLGEPIVLREKASLGKTIIEKFEEESYQVDLVFVIFSPDDKVKGQKSRRARQNVIFEAGFFYGKLQRTSGKIIFLKKGDLDLPSDISGVIHIDVESDILSCGEKLRVEIEELGWL